METKVPTIPIHEPFPKRWSDPITIISEEDLKQAESSESSDSVDGEATMTQNDLNGNIQIIKGLNPKMPDIRIHTELLTKDISKGGSGSDHYRQGSPVFRTPQKLKSDYAQSLAPLSADMHKSMSETYLKDLMLAERSNSRSPPSPAVGSRSPLPLQVIERSTCRSPNSPVARSRSPPSLQIAERQTCRSPNSSAVGSRSPVLESRSPVTHAPPSGQCQYGVFNFSPENTAMYRAQQEEESRRIRKRLFEEISSGKCLKVHYNKLFL